MIEHPGRNALAASSTPACTSSAQSNKDLRSFMREPFTSRGFPDYEMDWYGAPGGEYAKGTDEDRGYPGLRPRDSWRSICSPSAASTSPSCTR